jgi:hypothetical protein
LRLPIKSHPQQSTFYKIVLTIFGYFRSYSKVFSEGRTS